MFSSAAHLLSSYASTCAHSLAEQRCGFCVTEGHETEALKQLQDKKLQVTPDAGFIQMSQLDETKIIIIIFITLELTERWIHKWDSVF